MTIKEFSVVAIQSLMGADWCGGEGVIKIVIRLCFWYIESALDEVIEMITNNEFKKFEMEFMKREKVDIMKNFQIVDALYNEAVALGIFPLKNPLDGLEVDIKIARMINRVSKAS